MAKITRRLVTTSGLALMASACATRVVTAPEAAAEGVTALAAPQGTKFGAWGIDLEARDLSIAPGDDFYRYCAGTWLNTNEIPSDRTRWGSFDILADKAEQDVGKIIEDVVANGGPPGSNAAKIKDYYESFVDVDTIEARGLEPAREHLQKLAALVTHEDCARVIGDPAIPINSPIAGGVSLDQRNPDRYVVVITHAGLGLPERDYYLRDDDQFPQIREQYQAHIARMLTLADIADADAKAASIVAFEKAIAELHWPVARRRERDQTYNPKSRAELVALAPRFPWDAVLETSGYANVPDFVVRELDAIGPLANLFVDTPVATLKAYLTYHYLSNVASVLPKRFDDENFDFYGRTLNGQPEQRAREKRAVQALNGALGEAIGELYVAKHFPPDAKRQMQALVENVRLAYGQRIRDLPWMSPETKLVALEKLAAFRPKIGYPDKWRDYSQLTIRPGDAFGNRTRVAIFEWMDEIQRLDKATDRDEWFMTPQTVNAYYNPVFNEIVFPAAILQPPFFDPAADPAVNYGGIGGVIGHEMGHGFDDQGAKSDARGVLRDWWNEADVAAFGVLGDKLAAQYSEFEPLPGLNLNGRLGLGENIGDNGGLQVAYHAYRLSLNGQEAPELDGVTGDQRFFLSWGQIWRTLYREQRLRNQIIRGPHSPPEFRVNGVVRNMGAWYAAFNVDPGTALYLAPEDRVSIW